MTGAGWAGRYPEGDGAGRAFGASRLGGSVAVAACGSDLPPRLLPAEGVPEVAVKHVHVKRLCGNVKRLIPKMPIKSSFCKPDKPDKPDKALFPNFAWKAEKMVLRAFQGSQTGQGGGERKKVRGYRKFG